MLKINTCCYIVTSKTEKFKKGDKVKIKGRPQILGEIVTDPIDLLEPSAYYLVDMGGNITIFKQCDLTRAESPGE